MLQPARRKYRKEHKGRNRGLALRGAAVSFGEFGLKVTERGRLTARQIEAARRAISRHIKRGGRVWIRVFPDKPIPHGCLVWELITITDVNLCFFGLHVNCQTAMLILLEEIEDIHC